MRLLICGFLALGLLFGCSSARMDDHESDRLFRERRYTEAAQRLREGLKKQGEESRDSLLFLLDIGLSLHSSGDYAESNQAFLKADQIADIKDYTSLAAEGATLLTTDMIKDYKGEDFEKVLINTYLAMNFALMGNLEDSLVEARRVNHKLGLMVSVGKRNYQQSAFARYLSAILYEAEGNWNDAYIDYKNTYKLKPETPGLGRDLWRCAWALKFREDMEEWDRLYHLTAEDHREIRESAKLAEVIILYENGISPIKRPHPHFSQIPKFYPRYNPVREAAVEVDGLSKGTPFILDDIEAQAIENLSEKYAALIAKKIAGIVAKEGVSYAVEKQTDSPLLGFLTRVALYASDRADLRSWNLLPRDLQVLRVRLEPGVHKVSLRPVAYSIANAPSLEKVVNLDSGKKTFVNFRYMP